jgi:precorrin-6x reductase
MILVFGGTTEGKKVAGILEKGEYHYFYSTKTKIDFQSGNYGTYRYGAFNNEALTNFCKSNNVKIIIHASHPFAEELHQTIYNASIELNIPVIRFERTYPERINNELINYFPTYQEAINYLIDNNIQNLLALTGVQTIEKLKSYWQTHPTIFRILPRESSIELAEQSGFPKENLILEFPSEDLQHELEVIQKHHIKAILTKESGDSGFLSTKTEAALQLKIPILIIERCTLHNSFITVANEQGLLLAILQATESVEAKIGVVSSVERSKGIS